MTDPGEIPCVIIGGLCLHAVTTPRVREVIAQCKKSRRRPPLHVTTNNLDYLAIARRNHEFRAVLRRSDLRLADGMPLVWLSYIAGSPLPERVAGPDLTSWLVEGGIPGLSLYLVGTTPDVLQNVQKRAAGNGVEVVGHESPWGEELEAPELVERINRAAPDVLLLALESPHQQLWIDSRLDALNTSVVIGVGASLDYLGGRQKRAPLPMQRLGLEWLHRLAADPSKMWRRYIVRDAPYLLAEVGRTAKRRLAKT